MQHEHGDETMRRSGFVTAGALLVVTAIILAVTLASTRHRAPVSASPVAGPGGPLSRLEAAMNRHKPLWILAESQFGAVIADPGALRALGTGEVFEPVGPRHKASNRLRVIATADFHSETLLAQAITDKALPAGTGAVIYDNELFANTPRSEQANPLQFDTAAARLAAAHGLVSICDYLEPVRVPVADRASPRVSPCTVIGLNAVQQSERSVSLYLEVVRREVLAVHSVAPGAPVLAGLSANPRGGPVTAAELTADMRAVAPLVAGFWLNVPAPGVGCPACGLPDPSLMAAALAALPAGFSVGG